MDPSHVGFITLASLVLLALAFDFMNGFHDAANSIATVVSTGVLKPYQAVIWAAFFNVVSIGLFDLHVAATITKGFVSPEFVDNHVIFGALVGALLWNIATWYYGIPSSSSHALIGGVIGSVIAKAGTAPLLAPKIIQTGLFIFLSPLIGFALGATIMILVSWIFFKSPTRKVDKWFRALQLASSAAFSMSHGLNDAQKTMGVIWLLLIAAGMSSASAARPPDWVIYSCFGAIGLGTLFGGWRIVKTMGQRITKLKPVGGFAAETGGAMTILLVSVFGIPVSTTHTITGAIVGVGSATRARAVHWGVAQNIVIAWVLTIPASALISAAGWKLGMLLW